MQFLHCIECHLHLHLHKHLHKHLHFHSHIHPQPSPGFCPFCPPGFPPFSQIFNNSVEILWKALWISDVIPREQSDRGNPHHKEEIAIASLRTGFAMTAKNTTCRKTGGACVYNIKPCRWPVQDLRSGLRHFQGRRKGGSDRHRRRQRPAAHRSSDGG